MTVWANGTRTEPQVTSGWGWYYVDGVRKWHYGADQINFDHNCSPEAGTVVYAQSNGDAGLDIRIESDLDGTIFRMLHNDEFYVDFKEHVREGQAVGLQGTSGGVKKHVHFEVWPEGDINQRLDPLPWMRARIGSRPAGGGGTPVPGNRKQEDGMYYSAIGDSLDKLIKKGWLYEATDSGPVRACDSLQGLFITSNPGAFIAQINGDDLRSIVSRVGMYDYDPIKPGLLQSDGKTPIQGPGKLNGKIKY